MLRGSGGPVTAVAFGPDGQSLATAAAGGPDGRPIVTLWDLASGRAIRTFEAGPGPVEALAFSGDGRRLAAGGGTKGGPGWVTAWDAETGAVLGTLDRVGLVKSLAFHPDGARLAVADFGGGEGPPLGPRRGHADHQSGAAGASVASRSPRTGSGWRRWVTTATSTSPTPGPATRCWCSAASARPSAAAASRPGWPSAPTAPGSPPYAIGGLLNLWDLGPASGLAVEPEAGDLAGWLRRSRALAERGDAAGAAAAAARARDIKGGDASPWIEHAVSLYRRGDSTRRTGRPGPGHGGPARRPRALDRPRPAARAPRLDGGVGDGAGEGPVPLRAAARPRPRRRGGRRGPGRAAPGCRRIAGLDHPPSPT